MNTKVNKKAALRNCNTEKPRKGKIRNKQEEGRGGAWDTTFDRKKSSVWTRNPEKELLPKPREGLKGSGARDRQSRVK